MTIFITVILLIIGSIFGLAMARNAKEADEAWDEAWQNVLKKRQDKENK